MISDAELEDYLCEHIAPEPAQLHELYRATGLHRLYPHMCSGHLQGRILTMLTKMINPENVLEIGAYSGYSTLCIAEGLPSEGHITTIEIDDEAQPWLEKVYNESPYAEKIKLIIGDALNLLPGLTEKWDMAFVDGNKRDYVAYFNLLLPHMRPGGYMLFDNTLWGGKVAAPCAHDAQTMGIRAFNDLVAHTPGLFPVILPLRDGLTIIKVEK